MHTNSDITKTSMISMSDREFAQLRDYIYSSCGINITPPKKTMLEARLSKRLKELAIGSYSDYCAYLFSGKDSEEVVSMIDIVTTNKTEFFREPAHFEFMSKQALPELIRLSGAGTARELVVWSAGCSTGEEPYTLAIVLSEFGLLRQKFSFAVLATDISTRVLQLAKLGVYEQNNLSNLPDALKRKYFLRGKGDFEKQLRVSQEVRELVKFRRLNFMDPDFGLREPIDIIFCRNVIIYFDRQTQEKLLRRFCDHLVPGGYIFMGHSETLHSMNLPLNNVAPTVYRKMQ